MIQRLFLNGVNVRRDNFAKGVGIKLAACILSHPAETEFPVGNFTTMSAEIAAHQIIR
jgi:hypothetical protein